MNQKDDSGATRMHYAALNGHSQIVRLLVQRGADVNSTGSQFGATEEDGIINKPDIYFLA